MANLDDGLQRILDSPESLAKIAEIARSLRSEHEATTSAEPAEAKTSSDIPNFPELDPALTRLVSGAIRGYTGTDRRTHLLEALRPFAHEKNRDIIERALMAVRIARSAKAVLGAREGGEQIV